MDKLELYCSQNDLDFGPLRELKITGNWNIIPNDSYFLEFTGLGYFYLTQNCRMTIGEFEEFSKLNGTILPVVFSLPDNTRIKCECFLGNCVLNMGIVDIKLIIIKYSIGDK